MEKIVKELSEKDFLLSCVLRTKIKKEFSFIIRNLKIYVFEVVNNSYIVTIKTEKEYITKCIKFSGTIFENVKSSH